MAQEVTVEYFNFWNFPRKPGQSSHGDVVMVCDYEVTLQE